ncbi:hypothetical protein ACWGLF_10890 [Streptomyces puniciscabiei]
MLVGGARVPWRQHADPARGRPDARALDAGAIGPAVREPGTRTGDYRRGTDTLLPGADGESRI